MASVTVAAASSSLAEPAAALGVGVGLGRQAGEGLEDAVEVKGLISTAAAILGEDGSLDNDCPR